jgi:NADH-quinone oxidoreductase subunit M
MVQRVFWGPTDSPVVQKMTDITTREFMVVAPLLVLIVWIGVRPGAFLEPMEAAVRLLLAR